MTQKIEKIKDEEVGTIIERLEYGGTVIESRTIDTVFMNKINEIIDHLNKEEK